MAEDRTSGLTCPYHLRPGVLEEIGPLLLEAGATGAVVVTNDVVGPLHAAHVVAGLLRARLPHAVVTLPDGEAHKTLDTVRGLYDAFLGAGLERGGAVVALGGGVVGDTAGFAAATYLRGVALVQAPTTLLAMLDASLGGKVGVNLPRGKNLAGAFVRPSFVAADPETLETLPPIELRNGLAEMVKAALIGDPALFTELEAGAEPAAPDRIRRAAAVKLAIVAEDPYEHGRRALLNLGHTFAHAIELVSGYGLAHGQAVAMGLVLSARLAHARGLCDAELPARIERLLAALELPAATDLDAGAVIDAMAADKKRHAGRRRFVLPRAVGDVIVVEDISVEMVRGVLEG